MSKAEVDAILGPPDHSPIVGQYYHSTGGDCDWDGARELGKAPCGYVVDYRGESFNHSEGMTDADRLVSCGWGGIGE
jgi:hypothetical protein